MTLKSLNATILLAFSFTASAADVKHYFNITAQPLDSALQQFASQSGLSTVFPPQLTNGKHSSGLHGSYTTQEAAVLLLAENDLTPVIADGAMSIKPRVKKMTTKPVQHSSDKTIALETMTVTSDRNKQDYDTSYKVSNSSSATKTDTPIMETPAAIQVVTKKVMDDQQSYNVKEAIKNVSGVQLSTSPSNYENFVIRGFDASGSVYKNGLRQDSFAEETSNLQSIEVLKGPAAMLYGRVEPGGLVNLQTAKPLDEAYYSLQQQFGSYNFYRTVLDATGPVNDDKSLLYRLNFAYRANDSYRDLSNMDRIFLAPSLTWKISDRTTANILLEYQRDKFRADYGFPAVGDRPAVLPINRSLSDPAAHDSQESQRVFTELTHEFNDDWKLTHRFMVSFTDYEQYDIFTQPPEVGDTLYNRNLWGFHQDRDIYSTNLDLTGHFNLGPSQHTVLFGFDFYRVDQQGQGNCCDPIEPIDSLNPKPTGMTAADLRAFPVNSYYGSLNEWEGVYFQDQISFFDKKLQILGGGRYDWLTTASSWVDVFTKDNPSMADVEQGIKDNQTTNEKFNPRVGILYHPWNWLSIYGNYTEGLASNNSGIDRFNKPLAPQTAEQYEAGFKTQLFNDRLMTSVAYFNITKQNIAMPDLDTPDIYDSRAVGAARSQGLEVDINGAITDNWNVIASYAYTDTKITKDASCVLDDGISCLEYGSGNMGNQLPNAAPHSGSVWTTYNFKESFAGNVLSGLSLGTGVFVVDKRQGIIDNSFQLPGYVRWDASASYKWNIGKSKLTAQLNVRNILDKRYFAGADTYDQFSRGYGNIPGEPLSFLGSIRLEY